MNPEPRFFGSNEPIPLAAADDVCECGHKKAEHCGCGCACFVATSARNLCVCSGYRRMVIQ